ncbi:hypothetical protein IU510_17950 [Nocardia cyriacigeorgica]|uniref:hypothetical protein n=1 Tax=Nocardia cyriacigeorgica TaxID=135487 RepID=UPI001894E1D3|nr:hypothetical protein [Nocardia cyriacigeorgica]MBF6099951.1 hypothetical protein [Nocardia cyriacigeorgica]MBF6159704.1 hypothetical protein [Nocardia cyriacigeorgica]MBF6198787.1 hypothetical protein [Nocardia cyriacigeorgica]MBF6316047.1 hypothetical protein [Nocardia cyriacigeorgica]MBF6342409.1 hypothetical protein [Nocardia cyriacigeorgica]
MAVPETGQSRARQLYVAAVDGGATPFELDEDVASNLAAACDALVDDLDRARAESHVITAVSGFPDLPTGQALAHGFSRKGHEFLDTLTALQETALLYKAAYLAAGKKFADAEAANKAAIDLVAAHLAPR